MDAAGKEIGTQVSGKAAPAAGLDGKPCDKPCDKPCPQHEESTTKPGSKNITDDRGAQAEAERPLRQHPAADGQSHDDK